ncbi:hypothetical protein ACIBCD_05380 [Nocardia brasiliensis]|uniref:hypothetical protein n=1 Tax=Nocardia brasiliensis TaxID=37326 RepID=UPI0037BCE592
MALASFMVPLGTPTPEFVLPDLDRRVYSRADFVGGPGLLVVFASNHCPYVRHVESVLGEVVDSLPMPAVAICSNDVGISPDDAPIGLRDQAIRASAGTTPAEHGVLDQVARELNSAPADAGQ